MGRAEGQQQRRGRRGGKDPGRGGRLSASAVGADADAGPAPAEAGDGPAAARPPLSLDDLDRKIIRRLLVDGRSSARSIGFEMGRATVTVVGRMRRLEQEGVVLGYSARIDSSRLGYDLTAIIEVVARKDMLIDVERAISEMPSVCAVYDVTGGTDIMVIAKFRSRAELSGFVKSLASIPHVESTNTRVALGTVKEDFRVG